MKKTDKTGRRKNDKIEPIRITDDMLTDHEMDEFLRQSMIEEADRLEEELNSDPELVGIGASDDLFFKIKARLQEMGAWEEDDEETGQEKEEAKKAAEKEREEAGKKTGAERERMEKKTEKEKAEKETRKEREETEKETREKREEIEGAAEKKETEEKRDPQEYKRRQENREETEELKNTEAEKAETAETKKTRTEKTAEESGQAKKESREREQQKEEQEAVYGLLSEEDREALELGRKIQTRQKKKRKYRKKMMVAAAAVVIVSAVGMSGDADKNWILGALDRIMTTAGDKLQIDFQDNRENIKLNEEKEQEAWKKIKEELDIPAIRFSYKPRELIFDRVDISKRTSEVIVSYLYQETIMRIFIEYGSKNSSISFITEKDAVLRDKVISDQEFEIKIWDTTTDFVESYMVSFEYQDVLYFISGQLPYEELEQMVNRLYLY